MNNTIFIRRGPFLIIVIAATIVMSSLNSLCLSAQSEKRHTVRGYISDARSSESVISAGICCGKEGCISNEFGFWTMNLPEGKRTLTFSSVGYALEEITINLLKDTVLNVRMQPDATLEAAVIVSYAESGPAATRPGAITLPNELIKEAPALGGEPDVLKTMQLLPGVQSGYDGFSGIFVRGGGEDENLTLLDGVPVYNPTHMFGIFSVFTPEAVKKATIYKGAFPARYAGRVSSVVDVRTADGDMHKPHGSFSAGMLSEKFHLEGPFRKESTSFSISGRALHTFLLTPLMEAFDIPFNYWFYDLNAKVHHLFSDNDRIYLGIYHGKDCFSHHDDYSDDNSRMLETMDVHWGNTVASLRWNHVFNGRLFSNFTLASDSYNANSITTEDDTSYKFRDSITEEYRRISSNSTATRIGDIMAMADFEWHPRPSHDVHFGTSFIRHRYAPQSHDSGMESFLNGAVSIKDTLDNGSISSVLFCNEVSVYMEDDFSMSDRLRFDLGFNFTVFGVQGKNHLSPQPRLSVRYEPWNGLAFKAAYSRMAQYIHHLSSGSIGMPTDIWMPVTKDIRPLTTDQYSTGIFWTGLKGWEFSLEGWLKDSDSVLDYKDMAVGSYGGADWESMVAMGTGHALGAEIFARKTEGRTTGWISYTLSKTVRQFPDGSVNKGKVYPYMYDHRHVIGICMNHHLNGRIDLNASWTYASGGALTVPTRVTGVIYPDGDISYCPQVGLRGNYRMPATHRLDAGASFSKQKKHGTRVWNIGIYNVYAQKNPFYVESDTRFDTHNPESHPDWYCEMRSTQYCFLLFIPSFSYTYKF